MPARKPRKLPQVLAENEPELIVEAASTQRERLMLLLMLVCGLRVSEVARLRVDHLDFRRRAMWVRESKNKRDRLIPLPRHLVGPLRGYVGARRDGPVFVSPRGGHYTKRALQKMLKRCAVAAGISDAMTPRVRCHALRHVFCVRLLEAGVPIHEVRDLMGHSDLTSTNEYANTSPERLRDAIERPYLA